MIKLRTNSGFNLSLSLWCKLWQRYISDVTCEWKCRMKNMLVLLYRLEALMLNKVRCFNQFFWECRLIVIVFNLRKPKLDFGKSHAYFKGYSQGNKNKNRNCHCVWSSSLAVFIRQCREQRKEGNFGMTWHIGCESDSPLFTVKWVPDMYPNRLTLDTSPATQPLWLKLSTLFWWEWSCVLDSLEMPVSRSLQSNR